MPALQATKKQAQAVVCRSNVKQWAICYALYTQENDWAFPPFVDGTVGYTTYMDNLRPYYDDVDKMRTCPTAAKVVDDNPTGGQPLSFFGSTFTAWQIDPTAVWLDDADCGIGSYGENSWLRDSDRGSNEEPWRKMSAIKVTSTVPLLGDAKWNNAWPEDTDPLPTVSPTDNKNTIYGSSNWFTINNYVMRRHKEGLNMVFADVSARYVEVEKLWTLRWNRQYKTKTDVDLRELQ